MDDSRIKHLEMIHGKGLFKAIEARAFAEVTRSETGGKGLEGVIPRETGYLNPFFEILE